MGFGPIKQMNANLFGCGLSSNSKSSRNCWFIDDGGRNLLFSFSYSSSSLGCLFVSTRV